jgi:sialate O-acetylesterase
MKNNLHTLLVLACLLQLTASRSRADAQPLLHEVFADHAVLQRGRPIPVWGDSVPAERITIEIGANSAETRADASGHWHAALPAMPAGGPYEIRVRTRSGAAQTIVDILIGDVFLCSGQSNMEFPVSRSLGGSGEIAAAKNDSIRMLSIAHDSSALPLAHFKSPVAWAAASPDTVPNFSAVCYFFARELQRTQRVPLGLIHSSWGGSRIEPWMSDRALRAVGGFDARLDLLRLFARDQTAANNGQGRMWEEWWHARAQSKPWQGDGVWIDVPEPMRDWKTWNVPELQNHDGMLWFRRDVTLSAQQAAAAATLSIGGIDEVDETWVNGKPIGYSFGYGTERTYPVPRGVLRAGANSIVINVLSVWGAAGMYGPPEHMALRFADGGAVGLARQWRYQLIPESLGLPPRAPWDSVGGLAAVHNAMISPLAPYGLQGVLWYQGESNAADAAQYRQLLQGLMGDWRNEFAGELPFLVVELPNFGKLATHPAASDWANLRDAQRRAVLSDAHAALAVTIDLGEAQELHPPNKQDVGRRLARAALHLIYNQSQAPSGPVPRDAIREGGKVAVRFDGVEGGLITYSSKRAIGFELCSAEQSSCRFADAVVETSRVLLDPVDISGATRVRFCWGDTPLCNLSDESGLPAGPFEIPIRQ